MIRANSFPGFKVARDWRGEENQLCGLFFTPELNQTLDDARESERRDEQDNGSAGSAPERVRFKGIVEAEGPSGANYGVLTFERKERRWSALTRQAVLVSRLAAIFVFFSFLIGPPLGNYLAHQQLYGTAANWNPLSAFGADTVLGAFVVPVLILLIGYAISRMAIMMNAAESIAVAAQQYVTPDVTAAHNADAVGEVVRGHMVALNEGLDGALGRLASVEAMIRQHVEAIEIAGEAIEHKATGAVTRVADERSRLMDLTESLNAHADSFAAAIAERANASIEALQSSDHISERVERDFDERLNHLEQAAERAVMSFESLRDALRDSSESLVSTTQTIDEAAKQTEAATSRANAAANAAAESAARNAANVSASAMRAAEASREAADNAIAIAGEEAERVARAALEAATRQVAEVKSATVAALEDMTGATGEAVEAARVDAEKARKAADDVSEAARMASEAAQKASSDVSAASRHARKSSEEALAYSSDAAEKIERRNQALSDARAALEKENERLESLIEEQRQRADRLAVAIASQTDRLTRLAEAQLREQEAAARLAEAQNEMQARAADDAERKKAAAEASQKEASEKAAKDEADQRAAADQDERERRAMEEKRERERREEIAREKAARDSAKPARDRKGQSGSGSGSDSGPGGAQRLEALARDIAERRPRRRADDAKPNAPSPQEPASAERKSKGEISWREILDAADDAEPLDLVPAAKDSKKAAPAPKRDEAADAIRIIAELQGFTHDLETRLYGDPPPGLQERYDRGDRNVFANRLLRLNEADVKRRIRSESARDRNFEKNVHGFLQGFETLLEDATTSDTADEELEEYLSSPLGRVYLLIGATVGYFA